MRTEFSSGFQSLFDEESDGDTDGRFELKKQFQGDEGEKVSY